ncbi:MAG TPA: hypothetical protein VNG33_02370, partial [Polyangiaceae bacterium]|nr:hypothetical protein [Polyangiaceae bacterium]
PAGGASPVQLYSGSSSPNSFFPGGQRLLFSAGGWRSVPLTGGTPRLHPAAALAGKLQFQSLRAWTWLGEADEPGVVELYTSFYERIAEQRLP